HEVARGQEHVVRADDLEDDHDGDEAEHHGQHPDLAAAHARDPRPRVLAERLGDELGRNLGLSRLHGLRGVGGDLDGARHQPAAFMPLPPVVMYSTTRWRSKAAARSWTT